MSRQMIDGEAWAIEFTKPAPEGWRPLGAVFANVQQDALECCFLKLAEFMESNWELDLNSEAGRLRLLDQIRAMYPRKPA